MVSPRASRASTPAISCKMALLALSRGTISGWHIRRRGGQIIRQRVQLAGYLLTRIGMVVARL
jgi:hypothetical protein